MKHTTQFDPSEAFIFVEALIQGPLGERQIRLILDTGASETFVTPEIMDAIGYSARDALGRTRVSSMAGEELGYRVEVEKFFSLGFETERYPVNVHDVPEESAFDGLLGLSFLRGLNLELRMREGLILSELAG